MSDETAQGQGRRKPTKLNGGEQPKIAPPGDGRPSVFDDLASAQYVEANLGPPSRRALTRIQVKKPDKQWYFRAHPEFKFQCLLFEDEDTNTKYYVHPRLTDVFGEFARPVLLRLCQSRLGTLFLFPVKLAPDVTGYWNATARDAAQRAETTWVSMRSCREEQGYAIYDAEGDIPEPEWPDLTVAEILKLGFGDRTVENIEHPSVAKLHGR
jgi:hypothetical protein